MTHDPLCPTVTGGDCQCALLSRARIDERFRSAFLVADVRGLDEDVKHEVALLVLRGLPTHT